MLISLSLSLENFLKSFISLDFYLRKISQIHAWVSVSKILLVKLNVNFIQDLTLGEDIFPLAMPSGETTWRKKKIDTSIRGACSFSMHKAHPYRFYHVRENYPRLGFHDLLIVFCKIWF